MPRTSIQQLFRLAIPSAISVVLTNGYRSVDHFWLQWLSTDAQAAVGSLVFVLIGAFATFEVTAIGAAPIVARLTGAGDTTRRRETIGTATTITIAISGLLSVVFLSTAPWIAGSLGLEGGAAIAAAEYLQAIGWTLIPLALTPLLDGVFVAMGDTKTPMLLHALSLALNIGLTPLFVFDEALGIPGLNLGVAGAAYASNGARLIATAIGWWRLRKATGVRLSHLTHRAHGMRIVRIGTPAALGTLLYAGVYWALLRTSVSPLGPHVNAALGIGFSALEGVTWPVFHGLSIAVGSIVGRALGAQQLADAKQVIRLAFPMVSAAGIIATLAFALGAEWLTGIFTEDPLVHQTATEYALILSASQLFVAWEALAEGVLIGAGDTQTVFWASVPFNILRIPLAFLFAVTLQWGPAGIWWAINFTTWSKALLKGWAVWRGRWQTLEVV